MAGQALVGLCPSYFQCLCEKGNLPRFPLAVLPAGQTIKMARDRLTGENNQMSSHVHRWGLR